MLTHEKNHYTTPKDGRLREHSAHQRLKQKIIDQEAGIEHLQQEIRQMPERIDLSKLEDYRCFERISNESKNLFDFVTTIIWNARKHMVERLLPLNAITPERQIFGHGSRDVTFDMIDCPKNLPFGC